MKEAGLRKLWGRPPSHRQSQKQPWGRGEIPDSFPPAEFVLKRRQLYTVSADHEQMITPQMSIFEPVVSGD